MSSVLNRKTIQFIDSANTPDYPVSDWIINPDLSTVSDQPRKYWNISGDIVTLMDQDSMDAVDAQVERDQQLKNSIRGEL